jgi:hypothetical protein
MRRIQQPIQRFSVPRKPDLDTSTKHRRNPIQGCEPQAVGLASLGSADLRAADACPIGYIVLTEPLTHS